MAPETTLIRQDELLIAVALFEYSRLWAGTEPMNAGRAWVLYQVICERPGLTPNEVVLEIV